MGSLLPFLLVKKEEEKEQLIYINNTKVKIPISQYINFQKIIFSGIGAISGFVISNYI
tara:strand:- start:352 stop:525 length:174 start_codon:yes stop_codon:yes gene_type:complete